MVISFSEPTLNTCPTASPRPASAITALTASPTHVKQRDCLPSPNTVIGRPLSACWTKLGTTIPYCPVWRGPTVLKNRTMHTGTCRSRRSEEHTSELQSHSDLVCRLLLEKNKVH